MNIPNKKVLLKSLLFDGIGMLTIGIPVVGPFLDILWAPYAAKKMRELYPDKRGKIASILVFAEEILPFTDVVPTFTLMYLYMYIFKQKSTLRMQTIKV
ncbi:hypothetical protein [Zunongwangia sp.]|uniref:hypothetical protein n=1 Tax=Zunongwangia sp. TaxID=1965325 RepID=UPI003AA921BB